MFICGQVVSVMLDDGVILAAYIDERENNTHLLLGLDNSCEGLEMLVEGWRLSE